MYMCIYMCMHMYMHMYMCMYHHCWPLSVSWDYGFTPAFIEQHLWWLKRLIFEYQSLSHLSHLKFVLGSVTVSLAFLIFLFSTCPMLFLFPVLCILCMLDSLFYEMPPHRVISTISSQLSIYVNGCRLHIPRCLTYCRTASKHRVETT